MIKRQKPWNQTEPTRSERIKIHPAHIGHIYILYTQFNIDFNFTIQEKPETIENFANNFETVLFSNTFLLGKSFPTFSQQTNTANKSYPFKFTTNNTTEMSTTTPFNPTNFRNI